LAAKLLRGKMTWRSGAGLFALHLLRRTAATAADGLLDRLIAWRLR